MMGGGSFVRPDGMDGNSGSPSGSGDGMQLGVVQAKQMMAEQVRSDKVESFL